MPFLPSLDRSLDVLLGTRARRVAAGVVLAVLVVGIAVVRGTYALIGTPPAAITHALLNGVAVLAAALTYALLDLAFARRPAEPLRALWTPFLLVTGLVLLSEGMRATIGPGSVNALTGMATGPRTVALATAFAAADALVGAALLLSLRPLVLARRTRRTLALWRWLLGAMAVGATADLALRPFDSPTVVQSALVAPFFLLAIVLAFRLAWIAPLTFRHKLGTCALCIGLIVALALALQQRSSGAAAALIVGGGVFEESELAVVTLFSRPLYDLVMMAFAFGLIYAVTALLSLLFHLPTTEAYARRSGEIRAFRALAELSGQVLDRDRLVSTVAEAPVAAGIAETAWLALADPRSGSLRPAVVAAKGLAPADAERLVDVPALAGAVASQGTPLLLPHAAADHRVRARPGDGLGSLLVLPLQAGGHEHGALFATRRHAQGFEEDDVGALATFAGQAALALQSASLFAQALEQERLARELALAREVQQRLLPQHLPTVPGIELAVAEESSQEVGGDYYDVVALPDGRLGVLVADVSGKGTAAAFYMAELKGIFQALAALAPSPGDFLARANEALRPSLGRRAFISAVYGVLDPARGTFTFARAGHCPVVMARADGQCWLLRADGLGLGLASGPLFRHALAEQEVALAPGDVFALYTDGLVERRSAAGEEFGYERLAEVVCAHRERPAPELLAHLLAAQRGFAEGAEAAARDDLSVVVLRWTGPAAPSASTDGAAPYVIRPAFADEPLPVS